MAIDIPADIAIRIRQRVERGEFPSAGEVIREAMRLLDERDRQIEELQGALHSGLAQLERGEGVPFSDDLMVRMRQDARDRFHRGERPKSDVLP